MQTVVDYGDLIRRYNALIVPGQNTDSGVFRHDLKFLVHLLGEAEKQGLVASVGGLPTQEQVTHLGREGIRKVLTDLGERYFLREEVAEETKGTIESETDLSELPSCRI